MKIIRLLDCGLGCSAETNPRRELISNTGNLKRGFCHTNLRQASNGYSPYLPLLGEMPNHTLWIPWPTAYLPRIGWVQVCGALVLCTSLTLSVFGSTTCTGLYLSFVSWRMHGILGLCFLPFIPSWSGFYLGEGLCLYSLLSLCFLSLFFMAVGLLSINPATLLHHACHLSIWASLTALPCFYFLLPPRACLVVFLSCQLIDLLTLSLGLPWPIYYIFTSFSLL